LLAHPSLCQAESSGGGSLDEIGSHWLQRERPRLSIGWFATVRVLFVRTMTMLALCSALLLSGTTFVELAAAFAPRLPSPISTLSIASRSQYPYHPDSRTGECYDLSSAFFVRPRGSLGSLNPYVLPRPMPPHRSEEATDERRDRRATTGSSRDNNKSPFDVSVAGAAGFVAPAPTQSAPDQVRAGRRAAKTTTTRAVPNGPALGLALPG
jgi:hypothetical protein